MWNWKQTMNIMKKIRVAIVDDHQMVIGGVEKMITESGVAHLTGKAYNVAGCWKMLTATQPDVLMLDVGLPDGSGMELCPKIKERYPAIQILMLTTYAERSIISHLLQNGASGYVLKNAMPEEIVEGIVAVASGKQYLSKEVDMLLKSVDENKVELSRRERELLRFIAEGYTSMEIADKMCLGYQTIRSYRKNLHLKLGAHNIAELTKSAIEMKLV